MSAKTCFCLKVLFHTQNVGNPATTTSYHKPFHQSGPPMQQKATFDPIHFCFIDLPNVSCASMIIYDLETCPKVLRLLLLYQTYKESIPLISFYSYFNQCWFYIYDMLTSKTRMNAFHTFPNMTGKVNLNVHYFSLVILDSKPYCKMFINSACFFQVNAYYS